MICSLFLLVFKYTMDVSQLVLQCDLGMGGGGGGGGYMLLVPLPRSVYRRRINPPPAFHVIE